MASPLWDGGERTWGGGEDVGEDETPHIITAQKRSDLLKNIVTFFYSAPNLSLDSGAFLWTLSITVLSAAPVVCVGY